MFKKPLSNKSDSQKNVERVLKGLDALKKAGLDNGKNIAILIEHAEYAGKIAYEILDELEELNRRCEWGESPPPDRTQGTLSGAATGSYTFTQAKLDKLITKIIKKKHNPEPATVRLIK